MRLKLLKTSSSHFDSWLTVRRLRAHGFLLALTLWSLYIWTLATPSLRDRNGNLKGTDFLHLYTLGALAAEYRGGDLYDINAQAALAAQHVPDAAGIRYLPLYPPQVSIFFAPLASLSYAWALAMWWLGSALCYGVCCYSLWRACPSLHGYGGTVALLAAGFPAFFNLIAWGQTSAVALACFTLMFFLLRDHRDFTAGLVLGCLIFKPQLGLAAAIVFVSIGAWKIVAGAVVSAAAQLLAGVLYYGAEPLRSWLRTLGNVRNLAPLLEPRPYQTHSLRTFWSLILPSMIVPWGTVSFYLYVMSAGIVLTWTILVWKRSQALPVRYSALLLATVLVAPHLTVYDLVILAPAFLLLADWLIGEPRGVRGMGTLLYLVYVLPLLGPLTRWTHVQLSVVAMCILVFMMWRESKLERSATRESP
ncbi:MAG TPA: glycosyltransferase family 87 protein [Candidatus Dormibacteraeota bacterium]|nr:glycosyltransferase family 87 protein [Candidatus Dormibacteraeota bacterium]